MTRAVRRHCPGEDSGADPGGAHRVFARIFPEFSISGGGLADLAALRTALSGRYTIDRELGHGGMATVYLARDLKHDREVALKVLRPELAVTLGPERFLSEITVTARLDHPHIITLLDSGQAAGTLYCVLPYIRGQSLRQRLDQEKQLAVDEALRVACQVAAALDYAHRQGVIHRDIKPENIFLHEGEAIVADFGIALAAGPRLSLSGMSVGTPQYMSPEQALAERQLDARTDIYSLGVVLYEMLVGEPPYTGASAQAIRAKSLIDPVPSARRLRETVPRGVDAALGKALAKAPADRFATASQFAEALMSAPVISQPAQSIAVLPFTNTSNDPENEYFADGMTDEIINVLTQIDDLRVAARTSSFAFKGKPVNVRAVADELQVGTVLEGSVRKAGKGVRITVRLTNAADGYHLWSEQFDREIHDVFEIQDEIARGIADRLKVTLSDPSGTAILPRPTQDLEAYQLYLKGRYFFGRRYGQSLPKAIECFKQAILRDPAFAAAYAGLAVTYTSVGLYGYLPPWEALENARSAAQQALACDDTHADGHLALGRYELFFAWRFDAAEREFNRAYELAPTAADALANLTHCAALRGSVPDVLSLARRAQALEPLSPLIHAITGVALLYAPACGEALAAVEQALELEPTSFTALWCAGMAYQSQGKRDEAIDALEKAAQYSSRSPLVLAFLGHGYGRAGRRDEARAVAAELEGRAVGDFYPGLVYWAMGEHERGFHLMGRGFTQHTALAWLAGTLPGNELLGHDPRWIALLEAAGLGDLAGRMRQQASGPGKL